MIAESPFDSLREENRRLNYELTESKRNNRQLMATMLEQHEALNAAVKQLETFTANRSLSMHSQQAARENPKLAELTKENAQLRSAVESQVNEIRHLKDAKSSLEFER